MEKEKVFIKPEAEIIEFQNDDIITDSEVGNIDYPWWGNGN